MNSKRRQSQTMRRVMSVFRFALQKLRGWTRLRFPPLLDDQNRLNPGAATMIKSILITRFQKVGDMILFIPTLRALKRLFPRAKIDLLALEPSGIETIRRCPYIDEILVYWRGNNFVKKWLGRIKARMRDYDFFITSCAETNLAREGFYLGVKYMIGFKEKVRFGVTSREAEPHLLDIVLDYDPSIHEVEQNLKIVQALGVDKPDNTLEYYTTEEDSLYIKDFLLEDSSFLVGIHAGSGQPQKRWPSERFAEVGTKLRERFGASVIFVGGAEEVNLNEKIIKKMGQRALNLSGKTTLGQLAALLKQIDIFIGNDSGPMHLAAALGAPSVVLWGPGEYDNWRPLGDAKKLRIIKHKVACAPCYKLDCKDNICMKLISVEEVHEAVVGMLGGKD